MRRLNTSGNLTIVTMFELLVSGQHGQSVLDCFLSCRDSAELTERQEQAAAGSASPRSPGHEEPRQRDERDGPISGIAAQHLSPTTRGGGGRMSFVSGCQQQIRKGQWCRPQ